jgi:hypothetical protein
VLAAGSREERFLAEFDDAVARIGVVAVAAYGREGGWREKIRAGLASVLWLLVDEPGLGELVVVDALGAGPRVLERRAQLLDVLAGVVDQGRAEVGRGAGPLADPGRSTLIAEGVVGAVLSVLHARLLEPDRGSLLELFGPLMAMTVLPYLGPVAAERELAREIEHGEAPARAILPAALRDPRAHRARRALCYLAEHPGASNREVAAGIGVSHHEQASKLLARLAALDLLAKDPGQSGRANAWSLTRYGVHASRALRAESHGKVSDRASATSEAGRFDGDPTEE